MKPRDELGVSRETREHMTRRERRSRGARRSNREVGRTQRKDGSGMTESMIEHIIIVTVVRGGVGRKKMVGGRGPTIVTGVVGSRVTKADPRGALERKQRADSVSSFRGLQKTALITDPLKLLILFPPEITHVPARHILPVAGG